MKKRKRERRQELSHAEKMQLGTVLPEEQRERERRASELTSKGSHDKQQPIGKAVHAVDSGAAGED